LLFANILTVKDIEIEIQARVKGVDKLIKFLEKNAQFTGEKYQKDGYYTPEHKNYLDKQPISEWLRLRESKTSSITYKKWHYDSNGKTDYNDEFESEISDIDQFRKIFEALDFKLLVTVEKRRKTWKYKDYEVAIDSITDLGEFVEVEYKANKLSDKPSTITKQMVEFLKNSGCSKVERNYVGYPFMLLFPDKVVFEEV
jgi:adenylate cyclase class 2